MVRTERRVAFCMEACIVLLWRRGERRGERKGQGKKESELRSPLVFLFTLDLDLNQKKNQASPSSALELSTMFPPSAAFASPPPHATRLPIPISRASAAQDPLRTAQKQRRRTTRAAAVEGEGRSEREIADADADDDAPSSSPPSSRPTPVLLKREKTRRAADSTDPIASALTRRFGLAGGLGWLAVLTAGVLSEQVKTRLEERQAEEQTVAASGALAAPRGIGGGVTVRDVKIGGGAPVARGMLLLLNVKARVVSSSSSSSSSSPLPPPPSSSSSDYFIDTLAHGAKPLVLLFGTKLSGGLCPGAELALSGMRAGGRRVAVVPPEEAFGSDGFTAKPTEHVPDKRGEVPSGAMLEYDIEVLRVSVPPS